MHALLDGVRLWRYDAVVLVGGVYDATAFTAVRHWRRTVTDLLDRIEAELSQGSVLLVMGIGDVGSVPTYNGWAVPLASRWVARLNAVTAEVCAPRARVVYVQAGRLPATSIQYREVAGSIARVLAPLLSTAPHPSAAGARRAEPQPELERQRAVDATGIVGTGRDARFDSLASLAREVFAADWAMVSIIDKDRQWNKAVVGIDLDEVPRSMSFCDQTIRADGPLVYGDLSKEPLFDQNPFVHGEAGPRFYAGFPIESPDGYRIGSLCVIDRTPRDPADVDTSMLRELALLVQREVWAVATNRE